MTTFDPNTAQRPLIEQLDVVTRQDTTEPRGVVIMPLFAVEDKHLQGSRTFRW